MSIPMMRRANPSPTLRIDQDVLLHLDPTNDDIDLMISQNSFIICGELQKENPDEVRSDLERNILPARTQWE